MGTRIFVLTIRVSMGGEPLFNRVVLFHHRTEEEPLNTVHLVYRCVRVDWENLAVSPEQVGDIRAVLGSHIRNIFRRMEPGESDPELSTEEEEMA
jgi:hypothetical protein